MATITATKLRTRSIESLMEDHLMANNHAVISVKGEPKFVIVSKERYEELVVSRQRDLRQAQNAEVPEDAPELPKHEKIIIETQPSLITKIRDKFFS